MRIAGIIAEYDPFHNGHAYHVARTRRATGCDYVVACVDGHFTQRGDAAMFSRWDRARMALACGVDAVFELPTLFAVRTADAFARGGVHILGGLGIDCLSFGCETDDVEVIRRLAAVMDQEPTSVSFAIQAALDRGEAHARARGDAVADHLGLPRALVNSPNLILATEYVRAIRSAGFQMEAVPISRRGGYHDGGLNEYASASAIRAAMTRGEIDAALACLPEGARPCAVPERTHPMDDILLYRLRQMSLGELASLPDMVEGLEHRLYRLCREAGTREELLEALKCKRYTRARLSRLLTHALLGLDKRFTEAHPVPTYARLIGLRRGAEGLMGELTRRSTLPIVSSPANLRDDAIFQLECHATDVWALLHDETNRRRFGRELTEKFIRV